MSRKREAVEESWKFWEGLELWHIKKSHCCDANISYEHKLKSQLLYYPIHLRQPAEDEPNMYTIDTHVVDLENALGFWIQNHQVLGVAGIWGVNQQLHSLNLSLSLFLSNWSCKHITSEKILPDTSSMIDKDKYSYLY